MAEEDTIRQAEDASRALDKPREFPVAAAGGYYGYQEEEIHLRDYLSIVLRRKWIVITFFVAVVATVVIGTFMMKPLYKASSTLKIDKENSNVILFKDSYALENVDEKYYQTQYQMLRSRNLAKRVIRQMRLDKNSEFTGKSAALPPPGLLKRQGSVTEDGISASLVDGFIKRIEVKPEPKSSLVNVGFVSYDPELAASVTNAIAKSFIELNIESKFEATQQARAWLENQLEIMKGKLEQAEEKLNQYAGQNEIIFLDKGVDKDGKDAGGENIVAKRLADLSQDLTAATSDRISKEALYNELKSGDSASSSSVMANSLVQSMIKDLAGLESEYNQNLTVYKADYPKMVRLKEHIDQLRKRIDLETKKVVVSIRKDYDAAMRRENYLKAAFEKQKKDALDLNSRSVQYQILKREADTNRELYNGLLQRMKETGISASITASNIQIIDPAEVPKSPFKPNKKLNFMLALMVGLFGGVGLAFLAEYLDNTIKTPEDIEKRILMPSLGLVPHCSVKDAGGAVELLSHSSGNTHLGEAYSSLRTFLLFSSAGKPPKVMMVTSARREEGKTTTSVNTAISLTKSDAKVLLVDADMRRPRLHKIFKVPNTAGLSSFLSGNREFSAELLKPTGVPNLHVMTSGPLPPNPAELLGSYRLKELIDGLYTLYNFIVIDTPPVLGLADAVVASTQTEGVIMVVRSGKTPREAAQQAKKILESVNAKLLGVVLNAINESHLKYGYYSYYNYYSQNYGSNEDK